MVDLIEGVEGYAEFMKHMPPLLKSGRPYEISVNYNAASNTFKVISWFEKFDWGWFQDDSGLYPNYLHCRILNGCQAVHAMQESRRIENEQALDIDDFIHEHGNAMRKPSRYDRD